MTKLLLYAILISQIITSLAMNDNVDIMNDIITASENGQYESVINKIIAGKLSRAYLFSDDVNFAPEWIEDMLDMMQTQWPEILDHEAVEIMQALYQLTLHYTKFELPGWEAVYQQAVKQGLLRTKEPEVEWEEWRKKHIPSSLSPRRRTPTSSRAMSPDLATQRGDGKKKR